MMKKQRQIKNKKKNVKGITLVALVVTIIVLLILAGIAINLTVGNNGLFTRAENAANTWKMAEVNEQREMQNFENIYDETLRDLGIGEGNGAGDKKPIAEIDGNETTNTETTDKEGNRVVVPAGFKVINPEVTVNEGIVIEDVSANNEDTVGNQFVWIPCTVDGANNTLKYDRYAFTKDDWNYRQTKLDEKDVDGSYKIQIINQLDNYYHEGLTKEEITSIEKYGGFYFGRYEAGTHDTRTSDDEGNITATAKIQSGLSVYNYITKGEANDIATRMYEGKSRLCSSYAWDTTLKFIDGENGTYAIDSIGENNSGNGGLKSIGYYGIKNIYDMGGNVCEWTTELYGDNNNIGVVRRRKLL